MSHSVYRWMRLKSDSSKPSSYGSFHFDNCFIREHLVTQLSVFSVADALVELAKTAKTKWLFQINVILIRYQDQPYLQRPETRAEVLHFTGEKTEISVWKRRCLAIHAQEVCAFKLKNNWHGNDFLSSSFFLRKRSPQTLIKEMTGFW